MSTSPSSDLRLEKLLIDEIIPYWRNPRRITDEAVNAVALSIEEYGYRQPIVVDEHSVIIIGHTRYQALRRLGYTEAWVKRETGLTPKQIKELRTVDNRTAEYSQWDYDKLLNELDRLAGEGAPFFADVLGTVEELEGAPALDEVEVELNQPSTNENVAEFICPSCFHSWEREISLKDIASGRISAK